MHFNGEAEYNTKTGYYGERAGRQVTILWMGCLAAMF